MIYSKKEQEWILKMYIKGYSWNDISNKHDQKKFPLRTKQAMQKFVSRKVFGKA